MGDCRAECKCDHLPAPTWLADDDTKFRSNLSLQSKTGEFVSTCQVVTLKDASGKYLYASPSFLDCFGIHPNKIINRTPKEIFDYDVATELEAGDAATLSTGKTDTRIINWCHRDGTQMLWLVKKVKIKDNLVIGIAFNITAYILACSNEDKIIMDESHTKFVASSLGERVS
jgi:PAS domain-containing protein